MDAIGAVEAPARAVVVMQLPRRATVALLGGFRLMNGAEAVVVPPRCQRLLAFLALRETPVRRSLAAGTLWPDTSEDRAHASLRSVLAWLRRAGKGVVDADSVDIGLADEVAVDLRRARQAAEDLLPPSTQAIDPSATRSVISLLSRELLPGWYDDWTLLEAENWRQLRLHALEALAARLVAAHHFGDAAGAALAAVGADPLRESAHVALVRVHLAEGNRSEALRAFERFRRLLHAELGLEPTQHLVGLVAGLHPVAS